MKVVGCKLLFLTTPETLFSVVMLLTHMNAHETLFRINVTTHLYGLININEYCVIFMLVAV